MSRQSPQPPAPGSPPSPPVEVSLRSSHPTAVISAVRVALRRAGFDREEVERFTRDAFASGDGELERVVRAWAVVRAPRWEA